MTVLPLTPSPVECSELVETIFDIAGSFGRFDRLVQLMPSDQLEELMASRDHALSTGSPLEGAR